MGGVAKIGSEKAEEVIKGERKIREIGKRKVIRNIKIVIRDNSRAKASGIIRSLRKT
jgi:hypothetical protein